MDIPEDSSQSQAEASLHIERAYTFRTQHQLENALYECDQAIRLAPDWADPYYLKGLILRSLGRGLESEESFRQAAHIDPSFSISESHMANEVLTGKAAAIPLVPWTARDSWLGFALFTGLAIVFFVFLLVLWSFSIDPSVELLIILNEGVFLIPIWVLVRKYNVGWLTLGFRRCPWVMFGVALALLFALYFFNLFYYSLLEYFDLEAQPDLGPTADEMSFPWLLIIAVVVFAPVFEEMFFRGFLFTGFRERYGWQKAGLISAALFAAVHLQPFAFPPLFIIGYMLAYLYQRSNSIWPCIALHFILNSVAVLAEFAFDESNIQFVLTTPIW